jgi:hypothetical protein
MNPILSNPELLSEDARKYFDSHPNVEDQLRRASVAYQRFAGYLNLTQARIIVRESGASTWEADLSATILRTDL